MKEREESLYFNVQRPLLDGIRSWMVVD